VKADEEQCEIAVIVVSEDFSFDPHGDFQ